MRKEKKEHTWQSRLHEIIYEADTPEGKLFDIILLILILGSIVLVMLDSVSEFAQKHGAFLNYAEWTVTILFTIEYILRIISIKKPKEYIFSYYGVIDLLSTIPKYLSLFVVGSHALVALRALRLLRIFRVLKLARFIGESNKLMKSLKASRPKIAVFLFAVFILSIILGTVMYLVEGDSGSGFTSIPRSVYWAIVTLTTVGYGDIAPVTPFGQFIAAIIMIMGYGIIAVPTGIVTAEYTKKELEDIHVNSQVCSNCLASGHPDDAKYCYNCGATLHFKE